MSTPNSSAPGEPSGKPLQVYLAAVDSGELDADEKQLQVMQLLQNVSDDLLANPLKPPSRKGFFGRLFQSDEEMVKVRGLYLWGGVGRGKTLLTDMFYRSVPVADKQRIHFHRFMRAIHHELRELGEIENPLDVIADRWIKKSRLLVLDEMHVNDITDAMLIGGLLTSLFDRGLTMITTSNVHPDNLYRDGLQRARFLPAIEQIKQHTQVHDMAGETDYRLRVLENVDIYFDSGDAGSHERMLENFNELTRNESVLDQALDVNGRSIPVVRRAETVVWFGFDALCNTPRSTHDYIEIATVFSTVFISGIEILDENRNDEARRLVNLIDELYDRHVNLVVSAEATPEALYTGSRLSFEFVRAASRLREMQTRDYIASQAVS